MDRIEYEIVNWKKYNPRSESKDIKWYRQNLGVIDSEEYEHLTTGAKLLYYILMDRGARRNGHGKTSLRYLHRHTMLKRPSITKTLSYFEDIGLIKQIVNARTEIYPTNERNVTNDTKRTTDKVVPRTVRVRAKPVATEGDLSLATVWLAYAEEVMEWKKGTPGFTVEKFAHALAKVKTATDLNDDGITAVLKFVSKDNFWRDKAVSPVGLLKVNQSGVRKIDTILSQMKPKEDATDRALREYAQGNEIVTDEVPF